MARKTPPDKKRPRPKTPAGQPAPKSAPPKAPVSVQTTISQEMLRAALEVAHNSDLRSLLLYVDGLAEFDELEALDYKGDLRIILIARSQQAFEHAAKHTDNVVRVPEVNLTRIGQIKMAVMLGFSNRLLQPGDRFVFVTGLAKGQLDTMMVMEVGREYEMFQSIDQPPLTEHIRRAVFERVLNMSLQLATEGREGKPVGAIFVVGDSAEVMRNAQQTIMNPFKGYPEKDRNILDDRMAETVKEFATIDGAFVIKGTGTIVSAGTHLLAKLVAEEIPQGLGARHAAAAAITAATKSIATTISESTGTVRIWRQGRLITEIERAKYDSTNAAIATIDRTATDAQQQ